VSIPSTEGLRAPLQDRSRRTLEHILSAGAAVFAERGYEGLSIAEVCRRAGVSTGALYTRFDGKDALVRAIHDHVLHDLTEEFADAFAPAADWDDLPPALFVERAVRLVIEHLRTHAPIVRAIVLRSAVDSAMRSSGAQYVRRMSDAFTQRLASRASELGTSDSDAAIRSTFAFAFESTSWDVAFGSDFRATGALGPDDSDDRLITLCRFMLLTPPPG
jgi:AcrR family transcriptional regulator